MPVQVANTKGQVWQWKHGKRKTDKDNALKLAKLVAVDEHHTVILRAKSTL